MKSAAKGWRRWISATRYSWQGLQAGWKSEAAIRQEIFALAILVPAAFWVDVSPAERALLILSLTVVLIVELLNTGIETVVDRLGAEFNELSGKAKDLGSAAVLLSLLTASVVWLIILLPQILVWMNNSMT
ncbi:MAG: diacylglycerol kinase [Pseudohongiella sp.]|nr:diacylglycerol kinase [Pseudohongiella sp.]MDP2128441.1 diacylglycerol kinase [Pseudohongiella sp.]